MFDQHPSSTRQLPRIFFIAEREFPDGNAGGTRVRYMAQMFRCLGYRPFVVSIGRICEADYDEKIGTPVFEGTQYVNSPAGVGLKRFFTRYITSGWRLVRAAKRSFDVQNNDIVVIYSTNFIFILTCILLLPRGSKIWFDVVERFEPESFPLGRFDPRYLLFSASFKFFYGHTGKVILISRALSSYFERHNCNTLYIPALYDVQGVVARPMSTESQSPRRIKLIYSGNPGIKESLVVMLQALSQLSGDARDRFELHFTGVSRSTLLQLLGNNRFFLDNLESRVVFHPWLSYRALSSLYHEMNFLYFIRESRPQNEANFPMKLPELMAHGVAPLTTLVGDYASYLVSGVNSVIAASATVKDCAVALERVAGMTIAEIDALGAGARNTAAQFFDFRAFAPQLRLQRGFSSFQAE